MSAASLYADENFPRQVVEGLRRRGHDVLTCQEAGNGGRGVPDVEVLAFARHAGLRVRVSGTLTVERRRLSVVRHAGLEVLGEG